MKGLFPSYFFDKKVLDIGSLDVNGCNKPLFWLCDYTGLDLAPGKNVTYICPGNRWDAPDGTYDTIISTECGEHDDHYEDTIRNAIRMLKPGGLFIYTCATEGRPEHGTKRTNISSSPFTTDYYKNLTQTDLESISGFKEAWGYSKFEIDGIHHDLRFFGIKHGGKVKFRPNISILILSHFIFFYHRRMNDYKSFVKRLKDKYL